MNKPAKKNNANLSAKTDLTPFEKSWRYQFGLTIFIIGHLILLGAILSPLFSLPVALSALLVISGETIALVSIFFLGGKGFVAIKNKIFRYAKTTYISPVGKGRHYVGIVLVALNGFITWFICILALVYLIRAAPKIPSLVIFGLTLTQQYHLILFLIPAGELAFLIGLYVLGANWWERFRALIVWEAPSADGKIKVRS